MNSDTTQAQATDEPRPVPRRGDGWEVLPGTDDKTRCYPTAQAYTWQEFAGLALQDEEGKPIAAVEMGGYGDITMVDPWTCQRLWMGHALGTPESPATVYDALRRLIDLAEREQFLG